MDGFLSSTLIDITKTSEGVHFRHELQPDHQSLHWNDESEMQCSGGIICSLDWFLYLPKIVLLSLISEICIVPTSLITCANLLQLCVIFGI